MKALVVDDQKACRLQIEALLSALGIRVDCAENGRDAVLLYIHAAKQGQPYRFVVMDNEMPVMDGCSAIAQIRTWERMHRGQADPSLICFVTGDTLCQSKYRYLNARDALTHFMAKPLDAERLMQLAASTVSSVCE